MLFRSVSVVSALIAMLLIPVFVMMNTAGLGHRLDLYNSDIITEGKDVLFAKLDRFLFDGLSGDNIGNVLKSLSFETSGIIWVAMAFLFVMLLSAIQLRYGAVKPALMRGLLYTFVIGLCLLILYPYYVMLVTAFRSNGETNDMYFQHIFPTEWLFRDRKSVV